MKSKKRKLKSTTKNPILILGFVLVAFLLSISVGFSALSTSLAINGNAEFAPIGMIRVMSITQDTLFEANERNRSFTSDTINVMVDINDYECNDTMN